MQDPPESEYKFKYDEFERDGEIKVRDWLAAGRYVDPAIKGLVQKWLADKDQSRRDVLNAALRAEAAEDRLTAKSAKNAAWTAAIAAIIAAIVAIFPLAWQYFTQESKPIDSKVEPPHKP